MRAFSYSKLFSRLHTSCLRRSVSLPEAADVEKSSKARSTRCSARMQPSATSPLRRSSTQYTQKQNTPTKSKHKSESYPSQRVNEPSVTSNEDCDMDVSCLLLHPILLRNQECVHFICSFLPIEVGSRGFYAFLSTT